MLFLINLLLISFQMRDGGGVLYLERTVNMITIPFVTVSLKVARFTRETVDTYLTNVDASRENRELKNRVFQLRTELLLKRNLENDNRRLRELLGLKYSLSMASRAARVIGNTSFSGANLILIDRGERDGIRPNMAVICEDGVVGRVWKVFPGNSHVQLISDPSSAVAVKLAGTEVFGILAGTGDTQMGEIRYVPEALEVNADSAVLTTGADGIFPIGVPVATVLKVESTGELFHHVLVRFDAPLTGLSYVLVLDNPSLREESK